MDAHQILMDGLAGKPTAASLPVDKAYRFMPTWKRVLATSVAKFNDCAVSSHVDKRHGQKFKYGKRLMFQGMNSDVQVAAVMYEYLADSIDACCAKYIAEMGFTKYPAKIGNAYKKGMVSEVLSRMNSLQVDRENHLHRVDGSRAITMKLGSIMTDFTTGPVTTISALDKIPESHEAVVANRRGRIDAATVTIDSTMAV